MYLISLMYFSNNEKNTAGFFMGHIGGCGSRKQNKYLFFLAVTGSKQIRVVAFMCTTFGTSFIFEKKIRCCKMFFDICNAEMAQSLSSLQKSEFLNLIISFFHHFFCQFLLQRKMKSTLVISFFYMKNQNNQL